MKIKRAARMIWRKPFKSWGASGVALAAALAAILALFTAGAAAGQQDEPGDFALGPQGRMVRGTVSAAAGDHLTVKTEEGPSYQIIATTNTRIMKDRQPIKVAEIHVGDGIGAVGNIDDPTKTVHALMLFVIDAAQIRKAREDLGKTFISGRIVAIDFDALVLTIKRPDNVTQKITVDESTSFKKGTRRMGDESLGFASPASRSDQPAAESITLADIHPGEHVFGTGGLKSGVFVPTELYVLEPRPAHGQHGSTTAGPSQ